MNIESLFVVSNPRSGSTQLVQYLRQVPGCVCFGEIFKFNEYSEAFKNNNLTGDFLRNPDISARLQHLYKSDLKQFWAILLEQQQGNPRNVGAKIFPKHRRGDSIWETVFSHDSRVLHLWRARVFDTHVSGLRAMQTGKWNVKKDQPVGPRVREGKVYFDPEKYLSYRKTRRNDFARTKAELENHPKAIHIEYSEIAAPEGLSRRLAEFFGVPVTLEPTLQKLATKPPIDYLENPEDALPYVDDLLNEPDPRD